MFGSTKILRLRSRGVKQMRISTRIPTVTGTRGGSIVRPATLTLTLGGAQPETRTSLTLKLPLPSPTQDPGQLTPPTLITQMLVEPAPG